MKKEEPSPFMDNLTINMLINSEKPLVYKQGDIDMQANVDMKVLKAVNSDPLVLGELKLVKGGTYNFQGKRFVVKKGDIYLTGDPGKPLLDVEVEYQAENYLITIAVSGTPAVPVINFSSRPSLTREQILSVILFDSEEGAGSNSSEDMMKMMGGAMAKSALANAGVKIDYLSLGTDGSMEVGKKITDKITVIYVNDEVSSVRVKYRHSAHTESVLEFDEISQSYDIVYRRDMSADDIIMLGRDRSRLLMVPL
jgi:translocation and assembly module TamB